RGGQAVVSSNRSRRARRLRRVGARGVYKDDMRVLLVAVALLPLHGKTIVIDPGHNGANWSHAAEINRLVNAGGFMKACDTTGTSTGDGYSEAAYNLDVARRLARILRAAGAHVVLTRTTNDGVGPCIN